MDTKFKLELNLQQMALIRIAGNIWLTRPRTAKISELFSSRNTDEPKFLFDNEIKMEISKQLTDIFEQVESMKLPYGIKDNLLHVMKPVGENLLEYLRGTSTRWIGSFKGLSFPGVDGLFKYIEFDCFGKVDEVKTFLNIYNANKNSSLIFLFHEACTYCLEDVIHSIWNRCSGRKKLIIKMVLSNSLTFYDSINIHIIQQYWMQIVDKNQFKLPYKITESGALEDCLEKANTVGVKYFINKFSQDDKNKIAVSLAEKIFHYRFARYMILMKHCQNPNQHTCNLFYLLAQMTENDKNKFSILSKKRIILLMIKEWPWKYLLLGLLDFLDKDTYYWMIKIIVEKIVDDYDLYKKIVYTDLWMISEIWKKYPNNLEESIVEICWSMGVSMVFKLQAVILVTSVIDDPDGVDKLRSEICQNFGMYCIKFIDEQEYEVVNLYLKNILRNDEERKPYEKLLCIYNHNNRY